VALVAAPWLQLARAALATPSCTPTSMLVAAITNLIIDIVNVDHNVFNAVA
jgi:hypothetical protein